MSLYDKASLVLIPSGSKTSKVYSQKPTNGDGDFTFSRSTAATRVNASGNIEKETQNLLKHSNTFDTTWSENYLIRTSGQVGYDGTNNAWLLQGFSGTAEKRLRQSTTTTGIVTLSVYAKAGTINWLWLRGVTSSLNVRTFFDLSNGTIGGDGAVASKITDVGGGWYRCQATFNQQAGFEHYIGISDADGSASTSTTGNLYIQDAQLEQGLVARDYIETTTTAIYGGITDNVPRLDYTDSSCPALLLEPQRTNLVPHSEYIGTWANTRTTDTANAGTSLEGLNNAALVTDDSTAASSHFVRHNAISLTSGTTYTFSFYAKSNGRNVGFNFDSSVGASSPAIFNLSTGAVLNSGSFTTSIEDAGSGWYRCIGTFTPSATASSFIYVRGADSGGLTIYDGDGTSGFYLYGAQLEEGSYATSYIPTYGSAVTRERDNCDLNDVTNIRGDRKGTIYVEGKISTLDTGGIMPLTYGSGTSQLIYLWIRTNGQLIADIYTDNVYVSSLNTGGGYFNVGDSFKIAVAYQDNDAVLYVNGTLIESDDNLIAPNPNLLRIGKYNAAGYTGGSYTNAMVFPTRLSNEELATLTTI